MDTELPPVWPKADIHLDHWRLLKIGNTHHLFGIEDGSRLRLSTAVNPSDIGGEFVITASGRRYRLYDEAPCQPMEYALEWLRWALGIWGYSHERIEQILKENSCV